jgi:ribosomal protein S18 acetylase RimI-like enzyme
MSKIESEHTIGWSTFYTFTSDDAQRLGYNPDLLDGLSVIKTGIQSLQQINGVKSVADWQSEYLFGAKRIYDKAGTVIAYDHGINAVPIWTQNENIERQSVMIVERNKFGISGAVDFRKYIYGGTGEPAVFIHWVGVQYEAQNKGVASRLYGQVFQWCRSHGIELVLSGVNPRNDASVGLHEKLGFVCEEYSPEISSLGPKVSYATERGVYIKPYEFTDIDRSGTPIQGVVNYYSKRL